MSQDVCQPLGGLGPTPLERRAADRVHDTVEVVGAFTAAEAQAAALRCLAAHPCSYCEVCQLLCPDQCITRDKVSFDILIDLKHCKGCGLCAYFCPKGAIRMELEQGGE
jgi:Pyruvate/2-oxoacid:ferredoxin oxidoreductase delta subunit